MSIVRRQLLSIILENSFDIISDDEYVGKVFYCKCYYNNAQVAGTWSITSGNAYATINENGKVTIEVGTLNQEITISCSYLTETATKTITISYDNQLTIESADTITGTSGNVIARYNSEIVSPYWSITDGSQYATIDSEGALTILGTGTITVQATHYEYTTTKQISVMYVPNAETHTEVDEDGNVTTETTTTTVDPETGATTETTTSTTTNEDGSFSNTTSETTTNTDGSSTSTSTTTNQDGSSSETQSSTTAPDESGTTISSSTTTNYDENGDVSGSSDNTTVNNADGSSTSQTNNYNADGDPTTTINNEIDTSGNSSTQDITYTEEGDSVVTGYTIDTSNNPDGEKDITGNGVDTEFMPYQSPNGFICHIRFRSVKTEQPNPPLVVDTEDKGSNYLFNIIGAKSAFKPWRGFHIRWILPKKDYSKGNLSFGYTSATASSSSNTNLTYRSDNVYDFTITYDPNKTLSSYTLTVRDNRSESNVIRNYALFEVNEIDFVLGYAINQQGEPYRYSNVQIYDFSVTQL